jgi:uncharacterized repeat protein (TIGR03803 family)
MRAFNPRFLRTIFAGVATSIFMSVTAYGKGGPPPPPPPPSSVVHSFTGYPTDGAYSKAGLVKDASGNFYGTTLNGGSNNYHNSSGDGAVFKVTPSGAESVIWYFGSGVDGWSPQFGDLIIDAGGNLYGTTNRGGSYDAGTVFELSPNGNGGWNEAVLLSLGGPGDGANPYARLALDGGGNLFGATTQGGASNLGIVFELSRDGSGGWSETVLYSFGGTPDGSSPRGVIVDASGNVYGTTFGGGANNWGTVFELSPPVVAGNPWTEKVLWNFGAGLDGKMPIGSLIMDGSGILYGTTLVGGAYNAVGTQGCCGTVFKLAPQSGGTWAETILWSFGNPKTKGDGQEPQVGLLMDSGGNLYGTCYTGGSSGRGTAFKLVKPLPGSTWSETILWNFASGADGASPSSDLVFDSNGKLWGTTYSGGTPQRGTVFKITP